MQTQISPDAGPRPNPWREAVPPSEEARTITGQDHVTTALVDRLNVQENKKLDARFEQAGAAIARTLEAAELADQRPASRAVAEQIAKNQEAQELTAQIHQRVLHERGSRGMTNLKKSSRSTYSKQR